MKEVRNLFKKSKNNYAFRYRNQIAILYSIRKVLELGSGVGLLGLTCLKLLNCKEFIFTDSHDLVLEQINKNILLNTPENHLKAHVYELNWQEPQSSKLNDEVLSQIDLLLASGMMLF